MQNLFDVIEAVVHRLRHRRQFVRGGTQRLLIVGDKVLDVADHIVEVANRVPYLVGVVGQQVRHRRKVLVEVLQQVAAVVQRGDEDRQILESGEQVVAVIAQRGNRLRQLDDGVPDVWALAAQVVGRGVDELP